MNMASFFPVYADLKFNSETKQVSTLAISLCIVAFEIAAMSSTYVHSKTIHLMGRRNALMIGLFIMFATNVALGLVSHLPVDQPSLFIGANFLTRFIQGYGDSLTLVTAFSVINLTFPTDRAAKIGMLEAAFGLGITMGPALGACVYGYVGYECTMYFFACQTAIFGVLNYFLIPPEIDEEGDQEKVEDS